MGKSGWGSGGGGREGLGGGGQRDRESVVREGGGKGGAGGGGGGKKKVKLIPVDGGLLMPWSRKHTPVARDLNLASWRDCVRRPPGRIGLVRLRATSLRDCFVGIACGILFFFSPPSSTYPPPPPKTHTHTHTHLFSLFYRPSKHIIRQEGWKQIDRQAGRHVY